MRGCRDLSPTLTLWPDRVMIRLGVRFGLLVTLALVCLSGTGAAQTCSVAELLWDVHNCGTCGNDCTSGAVHSIWACDNGSCGFQGCEAGWYDPDSDGECEYACSFNSAQEICNGLDDDCDGFTDEDLLPPSPTEVCGVALGATAAECTTGVALSCEAGSWECTFPGGVCSGGCSSGDEICDDLDNDCDGLVNENVVSFGLFCASDDGIPPPGHGECRTTGTYVCDGPGSTVCSASKEDCSNLPGGCTELCDGLDNDCDGLIDEIYTNKGSNAAYFVQPAVVQIGGVRWIFAYEASRPDATMTSSGTRNGYHCLGLNCPAGIPPAPFGVPLDQTPACSVPDRKPWFGVTSVEVEQTCESLGGFICDLPDMESACKATAGCDWGYAPRGGACTNPFTITKYCNLGLSYDFDLSVSGIQDGLLETASAELLYCEADWLGLLGNTLDGVFDITGNLREITKNGSNVYPLVGGSFLSLVESGASCDFDFYVVDGAYLAPDAGFRCCFDVDPTL